MTRKVQLWTGIMLVIVGLVMPLGTVKLLVFRAIAGDTITRVVICGGDSMNGQQGGGYVKPKCPNPLDPDCPEDPPPDPKGP